MVPLLRLEECLGLRVKDVDFERRVLVVRDGKGRKDRETVFPRKLMEPLRQQLDQMRVGHERDLADGRGAVGLPYALERTHVTTVGGKGVRSPLDDAS